MMKKWHIILLSLWLTACQLPADKPLPPSMTAVENRQLLTRQQAEIRQLTARIHALENRQLALTQSVGVLAASATPINHEQTEKEPQNQAALWYARGDYAKAIQTINQALDDGLSGKTQEDALWLLAQSHYQLAHRESALVALERLQKHFPKSRYLPDVLLLKAQCQMQMQQKDMARGVLRQIIRQYPNHKAAEQARNLLK